MAETEVRILGLFQQRPEAELSTTDIVKQTESYYPEIEKILNDKFASKDTKKNALLLKAQMHRRALYFLNKLIDKDILAVNKIGEKGEKFFSLKLDTDEALVLRDFQKRRLVIHKPSLPTLPIEGYEQKKIAARFEPQTWIERLNSVLLDSRKLLDLDEAYKIIANSFNIVNDVIAINDFELLFEKNNPLSVCNLIKKLDADCQSYGRKISLIIDFTNLNELNKPGILSFVEKCAKHTTDNIFLILDLDSAELNEHPEFFEAVTRIFTESRGKLYVKNQGIHQAPYILGRAGPYTFPKDLWKSFKEYEGKIYGFACAQSTVSIDVERFFTEYGEFNISDFNKLLFDATKSILYSNSAQRRQASALFEYLIRLNHPYGKEFFDLSRNYLRLWNYGWKKPGVDPRFVQDLLKAVKTRITKFANFEERIYMSCGMPTKFKLAFSIAGKEHYQNVFSEPKFAKLTIRTVEDLYSKDIKSAIEEKEALFSFFDGGDVLGIHLIGEQKPAEIFREVNILLTTYKIPFFSLNFEITREVKLDQFI